MASRPFKEGCMDGLPSVIRATYEGGFRIRLTFNDNLQGIVDFQSWLEGPVFELLKDPTYFQRFFIDGGTVVWPNGADIAPETLYDAVKRSTAAQHRAGAGGAARH